MKKLFTVMLVIAVMAFSVIMMISNILPGWMAFIFCLAFVVGAIKLSR